MTTGTDVVGSVTGWLAVASVGVASAAATASGTIPGGPRAVGVFWGCYVLYAVAFWLPDGPPRFARWLPPAPATVTLTVLGVTMFVLAPLVGWISILLVVTAVVAASALGPPGVTVVVLVQTVAAAVAGSLAGFDAVTVVMSVLAYGTFQAFAALLVVSARREEKARVELAVAHAELRAASVLLEVSSRAAERLRISRDLHDALGHKLTAIALELEIATHHTDNGADGEADEHGERARRLAKELLAEVRETVGELRTSTPGLRDALADLVRDVPSLRVDLRVVETVPVSEDQFRAVVRCVQELLTNALRHGRATSLQVSVTSDEDGVRLEVADDGRGIEELRLGHGLTGMRERFAALGGRVDFASDPGRGFRTTGVLPS